MQIFQDIVTKFQLDLIEMMYNNLARRCRNGQLTRQTFDVFFHSNGLIGQIIFLKFDTSKKGVINFPDFVQAFQIMVKGTLRQRADVLFQIYDVQKSGHIKYSQLLKILFSYPLEQLNKMLIEEPFLRYIGENNLTYYFGAENKIQEKNIIQQQSEDQSDEEKQNKQIIKKARKGSVCVFNSTVLYQVQSDFNKQLEKNRVQKGISKDLPKFIRQSQLAKKPVMKKKKTIASSTVINQEKKNTRKLAKIKSNVSSLTKKYANFLFSQYQLDKQKDVFSKQNFFKLIQQHPALFNVYLSGFHTYVWSAQHEDPQFLSLTSWVQNYAKEIYQENSQSVYLKYIRSTIFVFAHQKSKTPIDIINLQGLHVQTVLYDKKYGIMFKHRDGLYPQKQYIFQNKQIQQQWLRHLAQFRENSVFDFFNKLERIGGGNFSNVFRGLQKASNKEVAIKVIQTFKLSIAQKQVIKRQCGILRQCHHPNIVKFIGQYKTKTHLYIITELLNEGDLFDYTKKNQFLQEYQAAIIFRQLVDAILYVNNQLGIIHRDLKPQNVMIVLNDQKKMIKRVKLIDFGFGVFKDKVKDLPLKQKFAGTPGFIAPQIYAQQEYDEKIDTFSLGIILYFMLSGFLPFQSNFIQQIEQMTKQCNYTLQNVHWNNITDNAKDLISKLLCSRQKRLNTKQVFEHAWLQNIELLKNNIGKNKKSKYI